MDRPDWGPGGETVGTAVAVPAVRALSDVRPGEIVTGAELTQMVQAESGTTPSGLPGELIREMQRSADGYQRNYDMLQDSANRVLGEVKDPAAFSASFDTLSPGIRSKALRTLWRHPGIGLADLVDKVEPQLTLAEAHEAGVWVRKWAGCVR